MALKTFALLVVGLATLAACDLTEHQPEPTGECAVDEVTSARFTIDVGAWPMSGDTLEIAATCTVGAVGPSIALDCEDGGARRPVTLQLAATPMLAVPLATGDSVDFALRRKADAPDDRGFFRVRAPDGALLLAGARSYASVPGGDPLFFAPLTVALDLEACGERKTDDCRLEQRVVLEVGDGVQSSRVPHGGRATLPSGHTMQVGRAMLSMSSGDPKVCPLDETTPETYEYLIAAPAA